MSELIVGLLTITGQVKHKLDEDQSKLFNFCSWKLNLTIYLFFCHSVSFECLCLSNQSNYFATNVKSVFFAKVYLLRNCFILKNKYLFFHQVFVWRESVCSMFHYEWDIGRQLHVIDLCIQQYTMTYVTSDGQGYCCKLPQKVRPPSANNALKNPSRKRIKSRKFTKLYLCASDLNNLNLNSH